MFRPAGESDDEDYDDYDYYDNNDDKSINNQGVNQQSEDFTISGQWNHPRCLSPKLTRADASPVKDAFNLLALIRSNDVSGVRKYLESNQKWVDINLGASMTFLEEGGSRPIFVACNRALPDMISL